MKLSQFIAGAAIGFAVVGSAVASDKLKLSTMSDDEYNVVSMLAKCSVSYDKFSKLIPKDPTLSGEFSKQSRDINELLVLLMVDKYEAEGLIKWNQETITDDELPKLVAACVTAMSKIKSK